MLLNDFKINLIYSSPLGSNRFGESSFSLYNDDIFEDGFINCIGGIEFITNRHFIFLQLLQYEELYQFVCFLLRAIIPKNSPDNVKKYFVYDDYEKDFQKFSTTLKFNTGECITLLKKDTYVYISFLHQTFDKNELGEKYFKNIFVTFENFKNACVQALEGYFKVASNIVDKNKDSTLYKTISHWEIIKKSL